MYYGEGCEESSCSKGCRYSFTQEDFEKDSNIDIFFKREDAIKVMEERRIKALEKIQKQEEIALDEER